MKQIGRVLAYLKSHKKKIVLIVLFNILAVIFSIFSVVMGIQFLEVLLGDAPLVTSVEEFTFTASSIKQHLFYYMSRIIMDESYGPKYALLFLGLAMVLMSLFRNIFRYMGMYHLAPIRGCVLRDMRNRLFRKAVSLPIGYYSEAKKGDIISRMSNDMREIEQSILGSVTALFTSPIQIIGFLVALFIMSPQLTIFVLLLIPFSIFVIGRLAKTLRRTSFRGQKKLGVLLTIIEEMLSGLKIIKAFNAQEKMNNRFESTNSFYTRVMIKLFRRSYLANPVSEFLGTIVIVSIMWYGGTLILGDNTGFSLTPGQFMGYLMFFYLIIEPAKKLSNAYYNIQKGLAAIDRVEEIQQAENTIVEIENSREIKEFKTGIEYQNVSFKYEKDFVLRNIDLKIMKGRSVAIVGPSGAGKSTLVDLIPRFYDISEGSLLIDGIPVKEYKMEDLRDLMGIVTQEPILFNDSVMNNIAFGKKGAGLEEVMEAAKIANAHEFIHELKFKYYTSIGDRGSKLSGGQRQRLSIARAVLNNPPILILDEATSSLDSESEKLVQKAVMQLMQNRTSIIIAHRLSTIQNADEIVVMEAGEIKERGNHSELIAKKGLYKKYHDLQMFS